jgi:hypothetical protein
MLASKAMAITFALSLPSLSASLSIRQSGGDVTILTTFQIDQSCDGEHKKFIEQGQQDALELAKAVFDDCGELITNGEVSKCINWESQAVADYFGPKALNRGQRERIFDTFNRATNTRRSWFSDWWYNRYVYVFCKDIHNDCLGNSPGYTVSSNVLYPHIVYCPSFFTKL